MLGVIRIVAANADDFSAVGLDGRGRGHAAALVVQLSQWCCRGEGREEEREREREREVYK